MGAGQTWTVARHRPRDAPRVWKRAEAAASGGGGRKARPEGPSPPTPVGFTLSFGGRRSAVVATMVPGAGAAAVARRVRRHPQEILARTCVSQPGEAEM